MQVREAWWPGWGEFSGGRRCSVAGCCKPHHARDLCNTHYRRLLRHGDPRKTLRRDVYQRAKDDLEMMHHEGDDDE